ncbi:MAG: MBL fold metallo-hydrolase, partial [Planctomycetota bacterium]
TVIPTAGHTEGSVCYYEENKNIIICGDLLFGPFLGHKVTFLLQTLTSKIQPNIELKQQIESLDKLVSDGVITDSTLILPGHGPEYYAQDKPNAINRTLWLLSLCCFPG